MAKCCDKEFEFCGESGNCNFGKTPHRHFGETPQSVSGRFRRHFGISWQPVLGRVVLGRFPDLAEIPLLSLGGDSDVIFRFLLKKCSSKQNHFSGSARQLKAKCELPVHKDGPFFVFSEGRARRPKTAQFYLLLHFFSKNRKITSESAKRNGTPVGMPSGPKKPYPFG